MTVKTVNEPKVYLVSRPELDYESLRAFLSDNAPEGGLQADFGTPEAVIETAARLCYMSFKGGRTDITDFMRNLLAARHGSVFEHVNYGFIITGVSRTLTHELVRHRAGFAYSQLSQRYVDNDTFVVPPELPPYLMPVWGTALQDTRTAYDEIEASVKRTLTLQEGAPSDRSERTARRKRARQTARSVLPGSAETKIFATANVRAWRHFIEMRASEHADTEIRRLAILILDKLQQEAPMLFGDYSVHTLPSGSRVATTIFGKV